MKTRILLSTLLALTALPALASDASPFYKNQFVVTERESCARGSAGASDDVSPFFRNQFVVTKAEACAATAAEESAAARSEDADRARAAMQSPPEPRS
jgi:hypothetical protein